MMSTEKVKPRGRPRLPAESARSNRIVALVSDAELSALNDYSARAGLSVSDVIRTSVMATIANDRRQDS